jgi:hypothetical protein
MLCIGCEMLGTERKDEYWRRLIAETRKVYSGKLVYNTNHGKEDRITWVDDLDYLGTSAYYPVAKVPGDTKENMTRVWEKVADHLGSLSEKIGKKIIFMEIGCRSAKGCAMMPWDFIHREFPADEDEQANFFESCLTVMHDKPWFEGFFWWDWSVNIYDTKEEAQKEESGKNDSGDSGSGKDSSVKVRKSEDTPLYERAAGGVDRVKEKVREEASKKVEEAIDQAAEAAGDYAVKEINEAAEKVKEEVR